MQVKQNSEFSPPMILHTVKLDALLSTVWAGVSESRAIMSATEIRLENNREYSYDWWLFIDQRK